ncbi:MAG: 3-oxo-tetronate kinase [Planctomycetota bacterium]
MKLGCIADDFTGATDLGSMLVQGGMRTAQWLGVPKRLPSTDDIDAIVISLKTRSVAPSQAVNESLAALNVLKDVGCEQFFFKYCSTFDSTSEGNIGPVADALLKELGSPQTIFCPAFPENDRTVVHGHLFVEGKLLNESGMQHHPVNPMHDANLVRVLDRQSTNQVGLVNFNTVENGVDSIQAELEWLANSNCKLVIADALTDQHLGVWAKAVAGFPLVTGGSAIAKHLAHVLLEQVRRGSDCDSGWAPLGGSGRAAVLAGSCSQATARQIDRFKDAFPVMTISPQQLSDDMESAIQNVMDFAASNLKNGPVLIASTTTPEKTQQARDELGDQVANLVEAAFSKIAVGLIELDVRKLIVAGGETSGAVIQALGIQELRIGPEIDPGVPWTTTMLEPKMALALKSGNFGADDFFIRALGMLS